jgi:predicted peroxiredoxin
MKKLISAILATSITSPVTIPTVAIGSAIAITTVAAPAQAAKFTKVTEFVKKVCEIGGCFYVVEKVVEYFQTSSSSTSDAPDCSLAAKGCTIRTGGNAVKIGETRTIIRKVRIR